MAWTRIRRRRASTEVEAPAAAGSPGGVLAVVSLDVAVWFAAGFIVLFSLAARLYNVGWDGGAHLHPDERHLTIVATQVRLPAGPGEYFDSRGSRLNPYNALGVGSFVYGTLPLFLTKATAVLLGQDTYDGIPIVGRYWSALFSGATVLLVFLLGRRLYGPAGGLAAAVLMASAPLAIQHAHFFVVDPFLTFFTTAFLYFAVRAWQEGSSLRYALAGLTLGLGAACKITALLAAPVIVLAAWASVWSHQAGPRTAAPRPLQQAAVGLLWAGIAAFIAFRVAQPYAFDAPSLSNFGFGLSDRWLEDQRAQASLLSGNVPFPPSLQWVGRESYLYPLQAMIAWGMGPAFGAVGWLAAVYAAYELLWRRDTRHLLLLAFVVVYFGFMGRQFSLYLRYFLPLYPALAVLGGYGMVQALHGATALAERLRRPALVALAQTGVAAILLLGVLTGMAYVSIYTRPVTRLEASAWILAHVPPGRTIAVEHWDERVPGHAEDRYRFLEMPVYETDTPAKVKTLLDVLQAADYVVLSSNRARNAIPRNPVTYPVTARYYELLLQERLGFRLLRSFESYPGLLGIQFADDRAEESWSSYDHPRVLIFQKTQEFSPAEAQALLFQGDFGLSLPPAEADRNALLLRPADLEAQRRGGTWTSVFSDNGLAASHPTLVWLLALQAAAFAVTPMALVLFRGLPDRGYLLAKPLGLLLLAYPVWLLVSLKLLTFSQTTVLLLLAALIVAGLAIFVLARDDLLAFLRRHWRLVLFWEALFLAAFFLFRELRLENPDLWHLFRGGEKPMDLAYLTAVTRSTTLPPYDPWLSGGYINYYYLGHFFAATLSRLTTIPPEVTFNLAVPTFFAFTCGAAFSIAYDLAAAVRSLWVRAGRSIATPGWSPLAAGLLGVFLVALAGNLDGAGQLAERLSNISPWRVESSLPLLPALVNSAGGLWQVVVHGARLEDFDYWRPSRMLPPTISITEFPFFSFLFADLHAHMMAIPFQLLAIGGALALALQREAQRSRLQEWLLVAFLGLTVGSLRALNSWDYPPFLLLALAALLIGERGLEGGVLATARRLALKAVLLAALSLLLFKPFLDNYQSPATGLRSSPETTPLHQYLAHFGVFVALIGVWLAYEAFLAWRRLSRLPEAGGTARGTAWPAILAVGLPILFAACIALTLEGLFFVAVVLPALVLVAGLAGALFVTRPPDAAPRLFLLALAGLGLGLSAGVDLVTIEGDINRMNTVFKFYLHIWVAFALTAAFAGWLFLFVLLPRALASEQRPLRTAAGWGAVALSLLVLIAAIYPALATPVRLDDRFVDLPRTLDGMEFMRHTVYQDARGGRIDMSHDYEGIQWLRRNVQGTPVIVEGRGELYRSVGSRFSIYTGLPAVVGWDWHQRQQRGKFAAMVEQRNRDVDAFYQSVDPAQALRFLRRYEVGYVILGQLERLYYPGPGLLKLENGLGGVLRPVYSNTGLTIFEVRTDVLASLTASLP